MGKIKPSSIILTMILLVLLFVVCPPLISSNSWELFIGGVVLLIAIVWYVLHKVYNRYKGIWSNEND